MVAMMAAMSLQSCLDDDDNNGYTRFPNALVTLKTNVADGKFYLQLDDSTTVIPSNIRTAPYGGKELRALANLSIDKNQSEKHTLTAYVNWMDTIRTKPMAPDMGAENAKTYGEDPLELVRDWTTIVEDGYLTLRFRTYYGNGKTHTLNLVKTDKPYEVMLYHDAKGDTGGQIRDGLIAFRLSDLPDTEGKEEYLTLKWKSFSGEKQVKFKYRTRP